MSTSEDDLRNGKSGSGPRPSHKKQRTAQSRACDFCRRRKIRCDTTLNPGQPCSNCTTHELACTYADEPPKKRENSKEYVQSLEKKVQKMDKLLRLLLHDESLYNKVVLEMDSDIDPQTILMSIMTKRPSCALSLDPPSAKMDSVTTAIRGATDSHVPHIIDDIDEASLLVEDLQRLSMNNRFFGKSSGAMLVMKTVELKNAYNGTATLMQQSCPSKRPLFWNPRPWEAPDENHATSAGVHYSFPEPDLADELVELYFSFVNIYVPLLHRPTFEKSIQDGLHLENEAFACVFLLVCAIGSRYSEDPRVFLDGQDDENVQHSCGWKWFEQVQTLTKPFVSPPSLYDLQLYCLGVQYLRETSRTHSCWTVVGIGIRLAEEVGAHKRKLHDGPPTVDDELWKRAFWILVSMDRMYSSGMGRPCAVYDEDFDLDYPTECDDEYWENPDPEECFKQPLGKPSLVTYFVHYLKLMKILTFCVRTIYAVNKSLIGPFDPQWEQRMVAELDSALNRWFDSIPDHLRWDPKREDQGFFDQSVSLRAAYHHTQILIHRQFIPSPSRPSPSHFPSLAICTNAARSCAHILDIQRHRRGIPTPQNQPFIFTAAVVLLLNLWAGKQSGLMVNLAKELADVYKCMEVLRLLERRWGSCGKLLDLLNELAFMGDFHLPEARPPPSRKREREPETPSSTNIHDSRQSTETADGLRPIAGSRRLNKEAPSLSDSGQSSTDVGSCSIITPQPWLQGSSLTSLSYGQSTASDPCLDLFSFGDEFSCLPIQDEANFPPTADSWNPISSSNIDADGDSITQTQLSPQAASQTQTYPPPASLPISAMTAIASGMLQHGTTMDQYRLAASLAATTCPNAAPSLPGGTGQMDLSGASSSTLAYDARTSLYSDGSGNHSHEYQNFPRWDTAANGQDAVESFNECVDPDAMDMWSNAPMGFQLDEWDAYLSNLNERSSSSHGHQQ